MLRVLGWGVAAFLLGWATPATATGTEDRRVEVQVVESWPQGRRVELPPGQAWHLRLRYDTDAPARIWVRPYFLGREVPTTTHGSPLHEGAGETAGWFSLGPGQRVDEVRISTDDGPRPREIARHRIDIVAVPGATASGQEPAWVAENRARNLERSRLDALRRQAEPDSVASALLVPAFVAAVPAAGVLGLVLPALAVRRWRGGWRVAAALPLAALALVLLNILVGIGRDPTSHNLWPFEVLMVALPGLAWITALALARRVLRRRPRALGRR